MSISLPNGTILAAPSSSQATVSAAVTRILHLSNFSADLKTRDIQAMFKEWENEKGGFRIKWVDDTNALVVFADANVAKRAYLSFLFNLPIAFKPPATIRPYDKPDAAQIIASLAARTMGHRSSMSSALTSGNLSNIINQHPPEGLPAHGRAFSMSTSTSNHNSTPSGLNGFTMPLNPKSGRASISTSTLGQPPGSSGASGGIRHGRTGSASSTWGRQSFGGSGGGGVLNFSMPTSNSVNRLPTHSESSAAISAEQSRSSSASDSTEPIVVMDSALPRTGTKISSMGSVNGSSGGRRESVSADKALREVEKALGIVETQG